MIKDSSDLDAVAARWLRDERLRQRKTQEDVGEDSGVGQSAVSKAERLGISSVGLRRYLAMAKVLGFRGNSLEDLRRQFSSDPDT